MNDFYTLVLYVSTCIILLIRQSNISTYMMSPLFIFVLFSFLYTFFPAYYLIFGSDVVNIELSNLTVDKSISILITMTIVNILLFGLSYILKIKKLLLFDPNLNYRRSDLSFYCLIFMYPVCFYFVSIAPWPEFGEEFTIMHSFAAFSKLVLSFLFISELFRSKNRLYLILISFLMFIIFIVDLSRTFFFVIVFAILFASRVEIKKIILFSPIVLVVFFLFIYVTLNRNGINFSFDLLLWPFFSEGIFGSYGVYNVIHVYEKKDYSVLYSLGYFIDFFFSTFTTELPFNQEFVTTNSNILDSGKIYPFGGHFILSDAILYFNKLASLFIVTYFIISLWCFNFFKNKHPLIYIFLVANSYFIIKTPIFVFLRSVIVIFIFYFLFLILRRVFPNKPKTVVSK